MRSGILQVVAIVTLMLMPSRAWAQCVSFSDPQEMLDRSDAVFVGAVLTNKPTGAGGAHALTDVATFHVHQSWKGRPSARVEVRGDRPFVVGQRYLIFASGQPLSTSLLCRWAEPADVAAAKVAWLSRGSRGAGRDGASAETMPVPSVPPFGAAQPSRELGVEARVTSTHMCRIASDLIRVDLRLRLTVSNLTRRPLILALDTVVHSFRFAPLPDALASTEWSFVSTMFGSDPRVRKQSIPSRPDARFVTVLAGQPGATISMRGGLLLWVKDHGSTISAEVRGDPVINWTDEQWEEAKQRWRSFGELWDRPIPSGAFTLKSPDLGVLKLCEASPH